MLVVCRSRGCMLGVCLICCSVVFVAEWVLPPDSVECACQMHWDGRVFEWKERVNWSVCGSVCDVPSVIELL